MSFNCPKFIKEFKQYIGDLQVKAILEVGSYSGELKNAVAKAMGRCCYEM